MKTISALLLDITETNDNADDMTTMMMSVKVTQPIHSTGKSGTTFSSSTTGSTLRWCRTSLDMSTTYRHNHKIASHMWHCCHHLSWCSLLTQSTEALSSQANRHHLFPVTVYFTMLVNQSTNYDRKRHFLSMITGGIWSSLAYGNSDRCSETTGIKHTVKMV